jgi:Leucine-rich repeat (LRR) protein
MLLDHLRYQLTNLKELCLDANDLYGTIPTELGRLTELELLNLSWNLLTGTLPSEIEGCQIYDGGRSVLKAKAFLVQYQQEPHIEYLS